MTPLRVGDVCEVVGSTLWPEYNGRQVVVTKIQPARDGEAAHTTSPMPRGHRLRPGWRFVGWRRERLRKIDPPDWQAPTTEQQEQEA